MDKIVLFFGDMVTIYRSYVRPIRLNFLGSNETFSFENKFLHLYS